MKSSSILAITFAAAASVSSPALAQEALPLALPSAELTQHLQGLELPDRQVEILSVSPLETPADWPYMTASELGWETVPVRAGNQIAVLFNPEASPEMVDELLVRYDLQVVPGGRSQIGSVIVAPRLTPASAGLEQLGLGVDTTEDLLQSLRAEREVVLSAAPNTTLSPNFLRDAFVATRDRPGFGAASESEDWGIAQAHIGAAWPLVPSGSAFRVGVIDVGFAPHEDLVSVPGLAVTMPSNDHGNHVSGIICAQHNGFGVRGAVPNCTIVISTSEAIIADIEDQDVIGFYTLFSELIATVVDFIEANPDVKVINLSLGYNWFPNFQIDPTQPNFAQIRDLVRAQGAFFVSVLRFAASRDVAIVSAAGNDSARLPQPTEARWASPFNWAAIRMGELEGWTNGVVVEAHDQGGQRAVFSNIGGTISAPGVDVLSALATSNNAYGRLSGTSMASPYVTGALTLLRAATPQKTLQEHVACLLGSSTQSSSGTAMLDLTGAIALCGGPSP